MRAAVAALRQGQPARVVPADEERQIAREVAGLLGEGS
jgi:hypothetical protein